MDWMFVCPRFSCLEVLTPNMAVQWGQNLGRWLGYEGGTLINVVRALIRRSRGAWFLAVPSTWGYIEKMTIYESESRLSPDTVCVVPLILDFPDFWTVRNKCRLFKPSIYGVVITPKLTRTNSKEVLLITWTFLTETVRLCT